MAQIMLLHGWSDKSDSFKPLRAFLNANGFRTIDHWLGDYISLDNDVRIEDVAKRMRAVVTERQQSGELEQSFDLIVHSTGALVAREWIANLHEEGVAPPVKRFLMLAPANFGSRLASQGKSLVGSVVKGWRNGFETGKQVLDSLELASAYQWRLARRDLLDPYGAGRKSPYGAGDIWPFVVVGTRGWEGGLQTIVNEEGSDGTVRAAAANLNAHGLTIDFSVNPDQPEFRVWQPRTDARMPFVVLPQYNHGAIMKPGEGEDPLARRILEALRCDSPGRYAQLADQWDTISEETHKLATDPAARKAVFPTKTPEADSFNQYMQLVFYARDDHGQPVNDFFVEFYAPDQKSDRESVYFHDEVLEHAHTNLLEGARRCLYIDRSDLMANYYKKVTKPEDRVLAMSVSAAQLGPNVRYFDNAKRGASGHVVVHAKDLNDRENLPARFHRNSTHLIELILPRQPMPDVFKLKRGA